MAMKRNYEHIVIFIVVNYYVVGYELMRFQ